MGSFLQQYFHALYIRTLRAASRAFIAGRPYGLLLYIAAPTARRCAPASPPPVCAPWVRFASRREPTQSSIPATTAARRFLAPAGFCQVSLSFCRAYFHVRARKVFKKPGVRSPEAQAASTAVTSYIYNIFLDIYYIYTWYNIYIYIYIYIPDTRPSFGVTVGWSRLWHQDGFVRLDLGYPATFSSRKPQLKQQPMYIDSQPNELIFL